MVPLEQPLPVVRHATWSGKRLKKWRSPVCHLPLMNCTMPTRLPQPRARAATPNAALDLPWPLPVYTSTSPRSGFTARATLARGPVLITESTLAGTWHASWTSGNVHVHVAKEVPRFLDVIRVPTDYQRPASKAHPAPNRLLSRARTPSVSM